MTIPQLSAGVWVDGTPITPAQMNQLNALLPNLPDLVNGSTHTLAGTLSILGPAGLVVINKLQVGSSLAFTSPVSVRMNIPLVPSYITTGTVPLWTQSYDGGFTMMAFGSVGASTDQYVYFPVPTLPRGVTITGFEVGIKSTGVDPHSNLPATMPLLAASYRDPDSGTVTGIGTQVDATGSVAAYEALHKIQLACSVAYDPAKQYHIGVRSERGANARATMGLYSAAVTFSLQNILP